MSLYDGHPEQDDGPLTADGLLAELDAEWDAEIADETFRIMNPAYRELTPKPSPMDAAIECATTGKPFQQCLHPEDSNG